MRLARLWFILVLWHTCPGSAEELKLTIHGLEKGPILSTSFYTNGGVKIERSFDLQNWVELGIFENQAVHYQDYHSGQAAYYRAQTLPYGDRWEPLRYIQQIKPFSTRVKGISSRVEVGYTKFVIDLEEPEKVWFHLDALHHSFVANYLPGYIGISLADFDRASLYRNGQRLLLGTIFTQPLSGNRTEYGLQFVGNDPYPPAFVAKMFGIVKNRLVLESPANGFYIPEYEQARAAEESAQELLRSGIEVASLGRWSIRDATYSAGWAAGIIKFVPADQLDAAVLNRSLTENDILLTDNIPAEVPKVAGIIAMNPSSPGSHVAILAKSHQVPFIYLASEDLRSRARALIGKHVLLRAGEAGFFPGLYPGAPGTEHIKFFELGSQTNIIGQALASRKEVKPLQYKPVTHSALFSTDTTNLTVSDINFFGGKAANFGLLRRTIPGHSPSAVAISFNLWNGFMNQVLPSGKTLRSEIMAKLDLANQSIDPQMLVRALTEIQNAIKTAEFSAEQKISILEALSGFDRTRNIRFRSSSNVEDSESFIAAGLYDSYSGCVLDDTDADNAGPSACDPTEESERGVFRAIKKVFASFYNQGAYRERKSRAVREDEVGMALLVHHSFPDDIELANGVVLATFLKDPYQQQSLSYIQTSQKGALSVANPTGEALPEILDYKPGLGGGGAGRVRQQSSLIPAGTTVLSWQEMADLRQLLFLTASAYSELYPQKSKIILDYEFKKTPEGLVIKQIREVPQSIPGATAPIAVHEPATMTVLQSHLSDVFSNYYLKSQWEIEMDPLVMTPEAIQQPFYKHLRVTYHEDGQLKFYNGPFLSLPGYQHSVEGNEAIDRWSFREGGPDYELRTTLFLQGFDEAKEIQAITDWQLKLTVTYPHPRLSMTSNDDIYTHQTNVVIFTNKFTVHLAPKLQTNQNSLPIWRNWDAANDWQLRSSLYWVRMPETQFGGAGYTSPVVDWTGTTLNGFTTYPFHFKGYYAQTYGCERKNTREAFIFDPWLDPNAAPGQLEELRSLNIRKILATQESFGLIDENDQIRFIPFKFEGYPLNWW